MQKHLAALSPPFEAAIVLLIAFGWLAAISLMHVSGTLAVAGEVEQAVQLIIAEPLILLAIYIFLRLRGERFEPRALIPKPLDLLYGCGLAGIAYFTYVLLWMLASALLPGLADVPDAPGVSASAAAMPDLTLIALATFINAIFEELLLSGYLISRLRRFRPVWTAIHLSVMLRLLCHLDAGVAGVLEVIPLGLAFAGWFAITGQLWPLVIGHLMIDLLALIG